ncbi:MAG: hypothetical protein JW814_08075 [Candidatus Krumholzibacteriota bacterium]|nr:hypothetical protein [Candidatus Krumholzibacteriota bacterium]
MRSRKEIIDGIEKELASSWKSGKTVSVDPQWKNRIMREIRISADEAGQRSLFETHGRLIWRFSMIATGLTLFFLIYVLSSDVMPYRDLALLFLEDPAGFILSPPFV